MFGIFAKLPTPDIRPLHAEHSAACATIHAACFAFAWPQDELEALLASSTCLADGAFDSKTQDLVGFILTRRAADEAEVLTIAVSPRRRNQGIARRLIETNLLALAAQGAKTLFLEVESENQSALALYRRLGFEKVGERKSYYRKAGDETALAYIMRRPVGSRPVD